MALGEKKKSLFIAHVLEGSAGLKTSFPLKIWFKEQSGKGKVRMNNPVMLGMGFAHRQGCSVGSNIHLRMLMMLWFPLEFLGDISAAASHSWVWAGGLAVIEGGRAWPHWPCFGWSLCPAQSQGAYFNECCLMCLIVICKKEKVAVGHCRLRGRVINLIPAASVPGFNR